MSPVVRLARPTEFAEIGELTVEVYRALRGSSLGEYEVELRDVARRAEGADVFVAVDETGALLGSVAFATFGSEYAEQAEPGEAVFRMLAVASVARGQGVGEALVQACVDRARALRLCRLRLSTQAIMRDAHRLYERMGFVRTPENDWTVRPGIDLMTYALDLTER